ncbi:MAG: hypothetical protein ABJC62_08730 [Frankiaceae bacterium]
MPFCDHCGRPTDGADHGSCIVARSWEPPRYCPRCARRMVVQVLPGGWTARCVEHGATSTAP